MNISHPSFNTPKASERRESLRKLDSDLETKEDLNIGKLWEKNKDLLTESLSRGGPEELALAKKILGEIQNQLTDQNALDELYALFEYGEAVQNNTARLMTLNSNQLQEEFAGYESIQTTPQQGRCLQTLQLMSKLTHAVANKAASHQGDPPYILGEMARFDAAIEDAYQDVFSNPNPNPKDLIPDQFMIIFEYPQMYLGGEVLTNNAAFSLGAERFPSIDFRNVQTESDFKDLEVKVIRAMGAIGNYDEAALMIVDQLPEDKVAEAKEAVKDQLEQQVNEVKTSTYLRIFRENQDKMDRIGANEFRAELESASEIAALMAKDSIESRLVMEHLADQGFSPDDSNVWNVARDMFDVEDEWFKMSDSNTDQLIDASAEIAIVLASVVIPELIAGAAIAELTVLGRGALQILRVTKMSEQAASVLRIAGLSARSTSLINRAVQIGGKTGSIISHLIISGAISEVSAQSILAIAENKSVSKVMDETPWVQNILINAAVSGLFSIPLAKGKWPLSPTNEVMANAASRSVITAMKPIFEAGFRPVCAAMLANSIKDGEMDPTPMALIKELGPELYDLSNSENLTRLAYPS